MPAPATLPPVPHRRLLNESGMLGSEALLQVLGIEYTPELEQAVQQCVRQAVLHYADGTDTLWRQLHPVEAGSARA